MQKQKRKLAKVISAFSAAFFLIVSAIPVVFGQWDVTKYDQTKLPKKPLAEIISGFAYWLLAVFGFIAVIGFVVSGIMYLVSAGDEDTQERAKRAMMYSITGVIVGLVGLVVIYAVNYFLGGGSSSGGGLGNSSVPMVGATGK